MRKPLGMIGAALALALAASPALADKAIDRMMAGESFLQGKDLEKAIRKADEQPLGSAQNPVRVTMPQGQRLYLSRLRCSDGQAPRYYRAGNVGPGPFGNIVDLYKVSCPGAQPLETDVYMDMYHGGFIESRIVQGFTDSTPKAEAAPVKDPTG